MAKVLGTSRATIIRRLGDARDALAAAVGRLLRERLGLDQACVERGPEQVSEALLRLPIASPSGGTCNSCGSCEAFSRKYRALPGILRSFCGVWRRALPRVRSHLVAH